MKMNKRKVDLKVIKQILFFLILFSLCSSVYLGAQTEEEVLQNIKTGVLYYKSLIKNGKITLMMTQEASDAFINGIKTEAKNRGGGVLINQQQVRKISLFFEGKKIRCEQQYVTKDDNNQNLQFNDIEIYDGEDKLFWFINYPVESPKLRIREGRDISVAVLIRSFGYALFEEPLEKVFTSTDYTFKMSGEEKISDSSCYIVKVCKKNDSNSDVSLIWIDSTGGYTIRKIERRFNGGGKEVKEMNYEKYKDNMWYLQSGISKSYGSKDSVQPSLTTKIEVEGCDINTDLPKNIFDPIFPSGTAVIDQVANINYVIP